MDSCSDQYKKTGHCMTNKSSDTVLRSSRNRVLSGILTVFCLAVLVCAVSGCSKRKKVSSMPSAKSQLLMEIYDAAEKKQYGIALQKMERYRLLDPASSDMHGLEHTMRFNHLTTIVQFHLKNNSFQAALNAVQLYEKQYGMNKRTTEAREQLLYFVRLDSLLEQLQTAGNSRTMEQTLAELTKLNKERKYSRKIGNFIRKKQSKLKQLKLQERLSANDILCLESWRQLKETNDIRTAEALFSLVEATDKEYVFLPFLREELFSGKGLTGIQ